MRWCARAGRAGLAWSVVFGQGARAPGPRSTRWRRCSRARPTPRRGLFTRLAQRDAAPAGQLWRCETCDLPDCEHALRRAAQR